MSNFQERDLTLEHDAKSIFGRMYLPDGASAAKRVPLVIIAHGFGGGHEDGAAYARELARRGYAAFCFDFAGMPGSRSQGGAEEMTILSEQADLEDAYDELARLDYVDLNNVFFLGMSLGGAVAALAAAHRNNLVKGLILLYPAFEIPVKVRQLYPEKADIPETLEPFGEGNGVVTRAYLEEAYDLDFYELIGAYAGPVLILHGTADEIVASGYSVRAVNTYRHANLELIADVGHGFAGGVFKYAVRKIVDFLDEEADLADESGLDGDLNFSGGMGMGGMFG